MAMTRSSSSPRWLRRWAVLPLLAAALVAAVGCFPFDLSREPDAPVPLSGKKLMIAPFRMRNASYFESRIGAMFARQVEGIVQAELPNARLVNLEAMPLELTELAHMDRAELNPIQVAQTLGADYVMYGEIHDLRGKEPKSFGYLRGTLELSARVVHLQEKRVAWRLQPERKTYHYPRLLGGLDPMPALETDEEQVIRKVMLTAAADLAYVFTGKKPQEDEERY